MGKRALRWSVPTFGSGLAHLAAIGLGVFFLCVGDGSECFFVACLSECGECVEDVGECYCCVADLCVEHFDATRGAVSAPQECVADA